MTLHNERSGEDLIHQGEKRTDISIKELVYNRDYRKRKEAALIIAKKQHFQNECFETLKRLVRDENEEVWKASCRAMGSFALKNDEALEYIRDLAAEDYFWIKKRGINALVEFAKYDHRGVRDISQLISSGRKEIIEEAVRVLGTVAVENENAFKILTGLLRGREELILQPAILSMGVIARVNDEALSELEPFLSEENNFFRLWAASAIGEAATRNDRAFDIYTNLKNQEDVYVRRGLSKGLVSLSRERPEDALEFIERMVDDSDRYVRINAAQALGSLAMEKERTFILIQKFLNHEKGDVRRGAAEAILKVAEDMPDEILPLIRGLSKDGDYYLRSVAAFASVKIASQYPDEAFQILKRLVYDVDEYVRRDLAIALGDLSDEMALDAYPFLKQLLEDRESIVRKETTGSLRTVSRIKTKDVLRHMEHLVEDFDESVREKAAQVLGEIALIDSESAFDILRKLINDESPRVREKCAMSLEKVFDSEPDLFFDRMRILQKEGVSLEVLKLISKIAKNEEISGVMEIYSKLMDRSDEHNMEMNLGEYLKALEKVRTLRYADEIRDIFKTFLLGMKCRNINDIAMIKFDSQPVKTIYISSSETDSWIYRVLEVIPEMALRYKQIDGLGDKHIYLGKMLSIMDSIIEDLQKENYPETRILAPILHSWRGILTQTMDGLRGRSNLKVVLRTKKVLPLDTLTLLLGLENTGESMAENLIIELMPSASYKIVDKAQEVEIIAREGNEAVEFRVNPVKKEDFRVKFNITFDDFEMKGKTIYFADMVSFIDIPHEFKYIPNPYITGGPIKPSSKEMFFGRTDVFDFISNNLSSISQKNVLILQGERRTGKTSILYQLPQVLGPEHVCVFMDGQEFGKATLEYLLYRMAKLITNACAREGIPVNLPEKSDFSEDPWYMFKDQFMGEVNKAIGERYLVILFDEFEALEDAVTNGTLDDGIFDFIRNLMQHEERLVFIFAGLHRLEEMMQDYWGVMFNIAMYWKISFLQESEARKLITSPVEGYNMMYDDLAIEKIIRATASHPYFVQLLCRFLVNRHNEEKRNYITVQDVNEELANVIEKAKPHFNYVWALSSSEERMILALIPVILRKKLIATMTDIVRECEEHKLHIPRLSISSALRSLIAKDILERVSKGEVHYRFKVDFIRMWVEMHQPFDKVMEEEGDGVRVD